MRPLILIAVSFAAGCGSYWDLRKGDTLPLGCANLLNYYLDVDGDGWGQQGSLPTPLCEPDPDQGLTASNHLDCDDENPDITGRVGAVCPEDLEDGGAACFDGLVFGDSEFVVTCGDSSVQRYSVAEDRCHAWAGTQTSSLPEQDEGQRGLATLEADFEQVQVLEDWLESIEDVGPGFAVFVDLRWQGDLQTGGWAWPSGVVPEELPACGGEEPTVADFFPSLIPGDPNAVDTLEAGIEEVRLALILTGNGWCRGTPDDGGDLRYDHQQAHYLCERPRPDLAHFEERPLAEDES
ncbi:MAG: hypothetical protein KTR31_19220 [Myxococcales bacterium]|nr:hypothetical protein [Myxococcales bacterium]